MVKKMSRKIHNRKKRILIILLSILLIVLVLILIFFLLKGKENNHQVIFYLNQSSDYELNYGDKYTEYGAKVLVDNIDYSSQISIDSHKLNVKKLGKYQVKYYVILDGKEYSTYRIVNIVDHEEPHITLNGNEKINLLVGEEYKEEGAVADDNYDGDLTDKIVMEGSVDTSKEGEYSLTYTVTDSSGNSSSTGRTVTVKVPNIIIVPSNEENREPEKHFSEFEHSNTITKNSFTNNGFYIEGYKKENDDSYTLKLVGSAEYSFELSSLSGGKYKGSIDLSNVTNGTYNLIIVSNGEENLQNKLAFINRLGRAKVGNKLVSFTYGNDNVTLTIEDFAYQYDVLIDIGHGGEDPGASNEYIYEKEMNLIVSMYEKCRYEAHGYSVYMTRTSDTYGNGMGDASLLKLQRRAYEIGYVGAVSRIVYSNHHNAIGNSYYMGYEILLPGYLTSSEITNELAIAEKFNQIYPITEDHMRFYARDYDTEVKYSMQLGKTYNFKDNYAVNRIPHELFNVKSIIFEASYLTNKDDYNWYWNEKNWIKVSEAKLEVYINYLGGTYNPDNSSCLS